MTKSAADAIGFDLRVWTDRPDAWTRVRSDVLLAVTEALAAANIAVR
jgi:small-conductance mechanosensitive channel